MNAFVLSKSNYGDLLNLGGQAKKADLESRHVLFMEDGRNSYLHKLFSALV